MSAGNVSGPQAPPPNPPQLASPGQLASMNQSAQQSGGTSSAGPISQGCPAPKISWFSLTVMQTLAGAEQAVDGLTLNCQLPDLGPVNGVTSSASPGIRFDNLTPGGTADVLGTSHDNVVWEVTTDIS
jgi:hypothetical protein